MEIKCPNCGHEGLRSEFVYLGLVDGAGSDAYRLCPKCNWAVYSEEMDITDSSPGIAVWGMKALGRRSSRRPAKGVKEGEGMKGEKEDE